MTTSLQSVPWIKRIDAINLEESQVERQKLLWRRNWPKSRETHWMTSTLRRTRSRGPTWAYNTTSSTKKQLTLFWTGALTTCYNLTGVSTSSNRHSRTWMDKTSSACNTWVTVSWTYAWKRRAATSLSRRVCCRVFRSRLRTSRYRNEKWSSSMPLKRRWRRWKSFQCRRFITKTLCLAVLIDGLSVCWVHWRTSATSIGSKATHLSTSWSCASPKRLTLSTQSNSKLSSNSYHAQMKVLWWSLERHRPTTLTKNWWEWEMPLAHSLASASPWSKSKLGSEIYSYTSVKAFSLLITPLFQTYFCH